ncbi:E3 ubiquitin-protein ligase RNF25 isoform X3 [Pyrgilauda ruficollis]|uniref:E3 ubiquitin-protein ligase RNF25 isoform X3 n=1 Tax=Pyrgilauda ruficollis TaxID=221976 RepID=UPI001B86082A|nr:E3 ubiquitin-protein ligase RNF25 isoform X3 [Pyrgilauda ruficollis]
MAAAGEEAEATDWALPPEVEVLESIYLEELQVVRGLGRYVPRSPSPARPRAALLTPSCPFSRWEPWEISITLHPATGQDQDSQYVRFTLLLSVPPQYPDKAPEISIRNPRGLSDEQIQKISQTLRSVAEARLGTEVLYELIEKGKEILTDNNIPQGQCVICLYGFQEKEAFTKTQCYHYFHSHCLARYAQHMEEEILMQQEEREQHLAPSPKQEVGVQCPVCRETLVYDLCALKAAPPPQHPLEPYRPDAKVLQHQEELRLIFKRQQEKGGIIDPEAERNRYFISLQAPPAVDPGQAATTSELSVSARAADMPQPPSQASAPEPAGASEPRMEPGQPERCAVPREQLSKRERHRGERPGSRGRGRQLCSGSQEPGEEACHPLHSSRAPRVFSQRAERRPAGRHSQEFSKHPSRSRAAPLAERRELCHEDPSPVTETVDLKEEHHDVEKWSTEEGTEARGRKKENLMFNRSDHKAAPNWQGHHRPWDCGRWERSRVQERGSYPRAPRGRGVFRPSGHREAHLEKESGS